MKKYIVQKDNYSCFWVALLNAHIYKFNKTPIRYGTKRYKALIKKYVGTLNAGVREEPKIIKELRINLKENKHKNILKFKKWVIRALREGYPIVYSNEACHETCHSVLLTRYFKDFDSFEVIGAYWNNKVNPVEYLTWWQLIGKAKERACDQRIYNNTRIRNRIIMENTYKLLFT